MIYLDEDLTGLSRVRREVATFAIERTLETGRFVWMAVLFPAGVRAGLKAYCLFTFMTIKIRWKLPNQQFS